MFGLPHSTELNRRIAKEKLYQNTVLTPQARELIKEQIESIFWRNKLAASTMAITTGKTITEIQIFEIQLRQKELDKRVLSAIAKTIPYKILFTLVFGNETQLWMEVAGTFYNTGWQLLSSFTLKLDGLDLDTIYENLARQISGGRLGTENNIKEAVNRDKERQKLEREIATLEKKIPRETQFNKQVEINDKLKQLKAELRKLYGR